MVTWVIATTQRNPFPSFSFSSSLVVKRNLPALNVCINRFLHFQGIYILELKLSKNYPFSKQNRIILIHLSLSLLFLFSRTPDSIISTSRKKTKKIGKFGKFGRCYRNAIYCQIEIGKLKTLRSLSVRKKKSLQAVSEFCVRWSRTHKLSVTVN